MILVLVLLAIIVLLFLYAAKQRKENKTHIRYEKDFRQKEDVFNQFYMLTEKKEEETRETAKRRRVTQKDKEEVLKRDDYTCQICGISKGFADSLLPGLGDYILFEIDHIKSVAMGGTGEDINNLQTLCWRCNRKKGKQKTNREVAAIIDYGADQLLEPKSRSERLRMCRFKTMPKLIDFMVTTFGMERKLAVEIVNKVKKSNVASEERIELAVRLFCKLLDENKI